MEQKRFDPLSFILAIVLIFIAAFGLEATEWVSGLNRVTAIALIGVIFGVILGQSLFNTKTKLFLYILYSFSIISILLIFTQETDSTWAERVVDYFGRVKENFDAIQEGSIVEDNVIFLTLASFYFWHVSVASGYFLNKNHYWKPLSLLCVVFIIQQMFILPKNRVSALEITFFIFLFLLVARHEYWASESRWQKNNINFDESMWNSNMPRIVLVVLGIVILAWNIPFASRAMIPGTHESYALGERINKVSSSVQNFFGGFKNTAGSTALEYKDYLSVEDAIPAGEEIQYVIKFEEALSNKHSDIHWRLKVYDTYNSPFWEDTLTSVESINPLQIERSLNFYQADFLAYLVEKQVPLHGLPLMGNFESANRELHLMVSQTGQDQNEIVALTDIVPNTEAARITTYLRQINLEDLRSASKKYPSKLDDKYLHIDEEIKEDLLPLIDNLETQYDNYFDITNSITDYLRNNYSYTTDVPQKTYHNDPVVNFLLYAKEGYCNHFASAEVLLLRSLGIPSRLGVGYAQGQLDSDNLTFHVRLKDRHAWPEVYFEGFGWILFEPTPVYPNIIFYPKQKLIEEKNGLENTVDENLTTSNTFGSGYFNETLRALRIEELFEKEGLNPPREFHGVLSISVVNQKSMPAMTPWIIAGLFLVCLILSGVIFQTSAIPAKILHVSALLGLNQPTWIRDWKRLVELRGFEQEYFIVEKLTFCINPYVKQPITLRKLHLHIRDILPEHSREVDHVLNKLERITYYKKRVKTSILCKELRRLSIKLFKKYLSIKLQSIFK